MYKTQKTTIANVDKACRELSAALDNLSWGKYFTALCTLCEEEEKRHRVGTFDKYHPNAPSVRATGRFFAAHRVGEYLYGKKLPEVKDYLHLLRSVFYGAAIVENYRAECLAALERAGVSAEYLAGLDYPAFVSPEDVKEGGAA